MDLDPRQLTSTRKPVLNLQVSQTSLVWLATLADPDYRLLSPFLLEVEQSRTGELVVSNSLLRNYGVGRTLEEAIADYQSMLLDLYEELEASEATLSHHLREQLNHLRGMLVRR